MIKNLTFGVLFFENIVSGIHIFYIRPHIPVNIVRAFSNFRFSNVSKSTKTSGKDHSFYNTVSLKKPHSFYESQLN